MQERKHGNHCLYRIWADDVLLYIGVTANPRNRLPGHTSNKLWWDLVTTITVEHLGTQDRTVALAAEKAAIAAESPLYNSDANLSDAPCAWRECGRHAIRGVGLCQWHAHQSGRLIRERGGDLDAIRLGNISIPGTPG